VLGYFFMTFLPVDLRTVTDQVTRPKIRHTVGGKRTARQGGPFMQISNGSALMELATGWSGRQVQVYPRLWQFALQLQPRRVGAHRLEGLFVRLLPLPPNVHVVNSSGHDVVLEDGFDSRRFHPVPPAGEVIPLLSENDSASQRA
jgi:hypothetical protein